MNAPLVSVPDLTHRQKLERLQEHATNFPQVVCPIQNYFAPGIYAREMTIPAGTTVVGAVHKTENLAIISKGRLLVATPDGPV